MKKSFAIQAIQKHGMLLVFPIDNKSEPQSLWSVAYPKSKMKWEWDENGDDRVSSLWFLREKLSRSGEVIYTKWFRGRATFFSRPVFTALLAQFICEPHFTQNLSEKSKELLNALEGESPLSTKELKKITSLRGGKEESQYNKGMKELWSRLLIVAFGEVDEGAFPSLAIGATSVLFEEIFAQAKRMSKHEAQKILMPFFSTCPVAEKFYLQVKKSFAQEGKSTKAKRPSFIDFNKDILSTSKK